MVIKSAADRDTEGIIRYSKESGYLTGYETKVWHVIDTKSVIQQYRTRRASSAIPRNPAILLDTKPRYILLDIEE